MSALFDDAERFESHIVVGDTVRHVKDGTDEHVGPGTYSPTMANSKEFGFIGVSSSRRSTMDPPMSPRSSEYQRYSTGSVVRDGVWFHRSPFLASGPGPGEYSPSIITADQPRGKTAKPSSGAVGRQAWDLRGSAGGVPLVSFRGGYTVSSCMGNSPRMGDFSQVSLRNGVLLLRGPNDGHRTNGIGPGTYDGVSNRQDPMTKRSYNLRAQSSQVRRERSLSFSGTSSSARAFLSLRSPPTIQTATVGRPDLHLLARCMSPASAVMLSKRDRTQADAAVGCRSGGGSARSLSPKRNRPRASESSPRGVRVGVRPTWGNTHPPRQGATLGRSPLRGCRSVSPPRSDRGGEGVAAAGGGGGGGGEGRPGIVPSQGRQATRASSLSPHQQRPGSAPSSPHRRAATKNGASGAATGAATGVATGAAAGPGAAAGGASYTYDYFGLAGHRGAWRGLESVTAARAELGIESPNATPTSPPPPPPPPQTPLTESGGAGGESGTRADAGAGGEDGTRADAGAGGGGGEVPGAGVPKSLLPEGAPEKGVCAPPKETRNDLHKYFDAVNSSAANLDAGSRLPTPPPMDA